MKRTKLIGFALLAILVGVVGFYACEKTYVEPSSPTEILDAPKLIIAPAVWRITSFQWKNKESNDHFFGYTFNFNSDGTIQVVHNDIVEYGKFIKANNTLQMKFNEGPLNELNCTWTVVEHTANSIALKGLSPYDSSSQYLEMEKSDFNPPTATEFAE